MLFYIQIDGESSFITLVNESNSIVFLIVKSEIKKEIRVNFLNSVFMRKVFGKQSLFMSPLTNLLEIFRPIPADSYVDVAQ